MHGTWDHKKVEFKKAYFGSYTVYYEGKFHKEDEIEGQFGMEYGKNNGKFKLKRN